MYEVRFHGRGGQGAVTAANVLAIAAFREGLDVQAFPMFGVERRGAPVMAFLRIEDHPIDLKSQIYEPDVVVVLDPSLLEVVDCSSGLKKNGIMILNTAKPAIKFQRRFPNARIWTVDATKIAVNNGLGTSTNPIVNTAILGSYTKAVGNVGLRSLHEAIDEQIHVKTENNKKAAKEAYDMVKEA